MKKNKNVLILTSKTNNKLMLPEVYVYFIKNNQRLPQSLWVDCFDLLPIEFHSKINRYYFWKDRQASLFGKLLLQLLMNKLVPGASLENLNYNKYHKPFIREKLSFNLSHSENYVVCAGTQLMEPIGIDIEFVNHGIEINEFKNIFSPAEWSIIQKAENLESSFFKLWTIKESVIKADGRGLQLPLEQLKVDHQTVKCESETWYCKEIAIHDEYYCHIATKMQYFKLTTKEISLEELLYLLKSANKKAL
ncbi:4'-phosphopantetheinyl transferase family protein [Flavobacteriaceae bacterium M23B6Z8]